MNDCHRMDAQVHLRLDGGSVRRPIAVVAVQDANPNVVLIGPHVLESQRVTCLE